MRRLGGIINSESEANKMTHKEWTKGLIWGTVIANVTWIIMSIILNGIGCG